MAGEPRRERSFEEAAKRAGLSVEQAGALLTESTAPTLKEHEEQVERALREPVGHPSTEGRRAFVRSGFLVLNGEPEPIPLHDLLVELAEARDRVRAEDKRWGPAPPREFTEPPPVADIQSLPAPVLEILCCPEPDLRELSGEAQAFLSRWPIECRVLRRGVEELIRVLLPGTAITFDEYLLIRFSAVLTGLHTAFPFLTQLVAVFLQGGPGGKLADRFLEDLLKFTPDPSYSTHRLLAIDKLLRDVTLDELMGGGKLTSPAYLRSAVHQEAGREAKDLATGGRHWRRIQLSGDLEGGAVRHERTARSMVAREESLEPAERLLACEELRARSARSRATPALDRLLEVAPKLRAARLPPDQARLLSFLEAGIPQAEAERRSGCGHSVTVNLLQKARRVARE